MQVMTEKTMTSSVTEIFPCSSGTEHHTKEVQGISVGTFETPAPPQVSGFPLKVFTITPCCYTCTELHLRVRGDHLLQVSSSPLYSLGS